MRVAYAIPMHPIPAACLIPLNPRSDRHIPVEHRADTRPERQIRKTDDARTGANRTIPAARGHGRNTIERTPFSPTGAQIYRTVSAIHRRALDENRRHDVVSLRIRQQLIEQNSGCSGWSHRWWCGSQIGSGPVRLWAP